MSNTLLILSAVLRKSMTNNENLGKVGHFIKLLQMSKTQSSPFKHPLLMSPI